MAQSKRTTRPKAEETATEETTEETVDAAAEGAVEDTSGETLQEGSDGGAVAVADGAPVPPAPEDPDGAGPADAGEPVESEDGVLSHALILSSGLMGEFPPEAVRGVLAGAPDPISVAEARNLVESFLGNPVVPTDDIQEA